MGKKTRPRDTFSRGRPNLERSLKESVVTRGLPVILTQSVGHGNYAGTEEGTAATEKETTAIWKRVLFRFVFNTSTNCPERKNIQQLKLPNTIVIYFFIYFFKATLKKNNNNNHNHGWRTLRLLLKTRNNSLDAMAYEYWVGNKIPIGKSVNPKSQKLLTTSQCQGISHCSSWQTDGSMEHVSSIFPAKKLKLLVFDKGQNLLLFCVCVFSFCFKPIKGDIYIYIYIYIFP